MKRQKVDPKPNILHDYLKIDHRNKITKLLGKNFHDVGNRYFAMIQKAQ
jgi:hypothetical protein